MATALVESVKDGIFAAGLVLIFLFAMSQALDDRKGAAQTAYLGYLLAVMTWLCIVNFFEFREGLDTRVGLSEAASWIFAPIGVVALIALGFAQFATDDDDPWWSWVGLALLDIAAFYGYLAVALGPSIFCEPVDPGF